MKSILTLIICIAFTNTFIFGQNDNYPKGVYATFDEVKQKVPSLPIELEIKRRTTGDIKMYGGNDYKLYKSDKSIKKRTIKKEYCAYSNGDSLFINCIHYKIQPWYTPVLSDGVFLVIRGGISMVPKIQKEQLNNQDQLGYMFGAVGGAIQGAQLAMLRFIYVIHKDSNNITTVSIKYLKELLLKTPELLEQYEDEKEQASQEVFIKYLKLINEID